MLLLSGSLYGRMPLRMRCAGRLECGRELAAAWHRKLRSTSTKTPDAWGPCKPDVTEQCLHTSGLHSPAFQAYTACSTRSSAGTEAD